MKILLVKPTIVNDVMYLSDETVECSDEGRAKFLVGMGIAKAAPADAVAVKRDPVKTPRSKQSEEIGESVGAAIIGAIKGTKLHA